MANRVLKLAAGSNSTTELPFTGLNNPARVAVDSAGAATSPTPATTGSSNSPRTRPTRPCCRLPA